MNLILVQKLNRINHGFYSAFAHSFAESRSLAQPSLNRLLAYVPPAASVLDLGCGNGRVARILDKERPGARYYGMDFSDGLIQIARNACAQLRNVQVDFGVADLTRPDWSTAVTGCEFDTIMVLAVLHHIPAFENRLAILVALRDYLKPGGYLTLSAWQFTTNERMRRKIVPWSRVDLDETGLEPGDFLLDWKRGGLGYRYCHLIDQDELDRLAASSGFKLLDAFRADGKEGDLSLFAILAREQ